MRCSPTFILKGLVLLALAAAPGCGEDASIRTYTSARPAAYAWPQTGDRQATHEQQGVTWAWDVPGGWVDAPELSEFHVADYRFPGATHRLPGRLTVSVAQGDGGGVQANINRWRSQLYAVSASGKSPVDVVEQPIEGLTVVELAGQYQGPHLPTRLAGAIVQIPDAEGGVYQSWFFKMVGDPQTVGANRARMLRMAISLRPEGMETPNLPGFEEMDNAATPAPGMNPAPATEPEPEPAPEPQP